MAKKVCKSLQVAPKYLLLSDLRKIVKMAKLKQNRNKQALYA